MNPMPTRWTRDNERGVVLIEFALVLPLLLVIFAGMFDMGLAVQRYQAVTNAAREGARMAVLPGYSTAEVESRVRDYLAASGVPGTPTIVVSQITMTPVDTLFTLKKVHVQVTHVFTVLGPIATLVGGTFGTVALTSESVMRIEVAS